MESMDDVYRELLIFNDELTQFNEHLTVQLKDLSHCHDIVSPLWQDEMRKTYDSIYRHLSEVIQRYATREGPDYTRFLDEKVMLAKRYLYG
jgi:hypothetical protein